MDTDHAEPRALNRPNVEKPENKQPMPAAMNRLDKATYDQELGQRYRELVRDLIRAGKTPSQATAIADEAMAAEIRAHATSVPARPMAPAQIDQLREK